MADPMLHIRGARVLADGADPHRPPVRDVLIAERRIAAVFEPGAPGAPAVPADAVVLDGTDRLVIPGLVNAHYHSYDTLLKGRLEDMPFDVWALHAQPAYWGPRSARELRLRTLLGALECLQNGITTVQDMNSLVPQDQATLDVILSAYAEAGLRVVFSVALRDLPSLDIEPFLPADTPATVRAQVGGRTGDAAADLAFVEAQIRRLQPLPRRLHWALGPSGPQRCSRQLLEGIAALSERYDLPVLTHVYETRAQLARARFDYGRHGGSLVRYLDDLGLLTAHTTLAHGVYLTESEIALLAGAGAGVVHNPLANLKLKNGLAPLDAFRDAGINVALGCDNMSCSDCQNLFQAMKFFTLLSAGSSADPSGQLAVHALSAATVGGARALGLEGEIGALRPGMAADLVMLNLNDYAYQPFNSATRQIVFSESGRGVDSVIVDGELVVSGGRNQKVDENRFRAELADLMESADAEFSALADRQRLATPYLLAANRSLSATDLGVRRHLRSRDGET